MDVSKRSQTSHHLLAPSKQIAIGDRVCKSLENQNESRQLLNQAKTSVEQLIEEEARS